MFCYNFKTLESQVGTCQIAPVAETGFSHRLTAYKIVGHFFGLSYRKISGSNQVKNRFFRISNISVPCPHAQLRGHTVIKKFWTFCKPWGRDCSQSPPCWIFSGKSNTSIHGHGYAILNIFFPDNGAYFYFLRT